MRGDNLTRFVPTIGNCHVQFAIFRLRDNDIGNLLTNKRFEPDFFCTFKDATCTIFKRFEEVLRASML